jgi:hypothetical protein
MIGTKTQLFDIQKVRDVQPSNGDFAVTFQNGLVACLCGNQPDRDKILREVRFSLRQHRPVGLLVNGGGELQEANAAHDTAVRSVEPEQAKERRLPVWFWAYSPVCYLTRDHPEFERIRATLEEAASSGRRVWLANRMHQVESETEIWWKILDVRPFEAGAPQG